jgi:hypothetical protein
MSNEIKTERSHRTWWERVKMWRRAYKTKVSDGCHEAIARGPTPEASEEAAKKRWVAEQAAEKTRGE